MMTKSKMWTKALQIAIVVFMALASSNSIWALKARAASGPKADEPYCSGMYCGTSSDCGSSCFCNPTNGRCY